MRCARNVARLLVAVTFCPVRCPAQNPLANQKPPVHPVNLNAPVPPNCTVFPELAHLQPTRSRLRKSYGGYKSVNELLAIKGIGREPLDKMHKYRTVGKIPPTKAASTKPVTPPKPLPKRRRGKSHTASLDRAPVAHPFHGEGGPIGGGNHGIGARECICGGADGKPQALRPGLQMKGPTKCLLLTRLGSKGAPVLLHRRQRCER